MIVKAKTQWLERTYGGPTAASVACPELADALCANVATVTKTMVVRGMHLAESDLLMVEGGAYCIESCAVVDGRRFVLIQPLRLKKQLSPTSSRWSCRGSAALALDVEDLKPQHAHCWVWDKDDSVLVLHKCRPV